MEGLANLRHLDVSHNLLRHGMHLRPIEGMVLLQHLDVSHNQLHELPDCIGTLERLVVLNVSYNRLSTLPPNIGGCSSLEAKQSLANPYATTMSIAMLVDLCIDMCIDMCVDMHVSMYKTKASCSNPSVAWSFGTQTGVSACL